MSGGAEPPVGMQLIGWLCQGDKTGPQPGFHQHWRRNYIMDSPGHARGQVCPGCFPVFRFRAENPEGGDSDG